uniref:Uncharacterized protein n=1 Tax=Rhizophora mucronata TaxID=61149 RepID=A0A2P2PE22_RHIMU
MLRNRYRNHHREMMDD